MLWGTSCYRIILMVCGLQSIADARWWFRTERGDDSGMLTWVHVASTLVAGPDDQLQSTLYFLSRLATFNVWKSKKDGSNVSAVWFPKPSPKCWGKPWKPRLHQEQTSGLLHPPLFTRQCWTLEGPQLPPTAQTSAVSPPDHRGITRKFQRLNNWTQLNCSCYDPRLWVWKQWAWGSLVWDQSKVSTDAGACNRSAAGSLVPVGASEEIGMVSVRVGLVFRLRKTSRTSVLRLPTLKPCRTLNRLSWCEFKTKMTPLLGTRIWWVFTLSVGVHINRFNTLNTKSSKIIST